MKGLDKELQSFANAVRQLGSSVGLMSAAHHLRGRLKQVMHLVRENASGLFDEIKNENSEPLRPFSRRKGARQSTKARKLRPSIQIDSDPETLPANMKLLADDLIAFLSRLNEIPEFTDEAVDSAIWSFEGDLKVGLCLSCVTALLTPRCLVLGILFGRVFRCGSDRAFLFCLSWTLVLQVNSDTQQSSAISMT